MSLELQLIIGLVVKEYLASNVLFPRMFTLEQYKNKTIDNPFTLEDFFYNLFHILVTGLMTCHVSVDTSIAFMFVEGVMLSVIAYYKSGIFLIKRLNLSSDMIFYYKLTNFARLVHFVIFAILIAVLISK